MDRVASLSQTNSTSGSKVDHGLQLKKRSLKINVSLGTYDTFDFLATGQSHHISEIEIFIQLRISDSNDVFAMVVKLENNTES